MKNGMTFCDSLSALSKIAHAGFNLWKGTWLHLNVCENTTSNNRIRVLYSALAWWLWVEKKRESNPFCSLYLILFQLLDCVSFWQRVCSGLEPISGGLNLLTWLLAHVCLCNSHHSKPIVLQDEQLFFSFFEPMRTYWVGSIPRFFLQVTLQYHFSVFLFMCLIKLYLACIKRVFI